VQPKGILEVLNSLKESPKITLSSINKPDKDDPSP